MKDIVSLPVQSVLLALICIACSVNLGMDDTSEIQSTQEQSLHRIIAVKSDNPTASLPTINYVTSYQLDNRPSWFELRVNENLLFDEELCVQLWQEYFWEMENTADEVRNHLLSNTKMFIDGISVGGEHTSVFFTFVMYTVKDNSGNLLGSFGGEFN